MKPTHILIVLRVTSGQYEHTSHLVTTLPEGETLDAYADRAAREFYGEAEYEGEETPSGYSFNGGEVLVKVTRAQVITKAEADTLKRLL
jgi:hypothetical protein